MSRFVGTDHRVQAGCNHEWFISRQRRSPLVQKLLFKIILECHQSVIQLDTDQAHLIWLQNSADDKKRLSLAGKGLVSVINVPIGSLAVGGVSDQIH